MKTKTLLFTLSLLISHSLFAQYPLVTIKDIQEATSANLSNCVDESPMVGDTVTVRGKVVMDGGLEQLTSAKQVWLQSDTGGPWSGLDIYDVIANGTTEDIDNLLAGDSIEIVGVVLEYQGETELAPIGANSVTLYGQSQTIHSTVVSVGAFNDNQQNNILTTGEQWEGVFCEIQNVTVVSVDFFTSGGDRVSFTVQDQNGNVMNVGDRFAVQRLPSNGGNFSAPNVGDAFDFIKGVILHSKNDCPGFSNGRGYEIHPFHEDHYEYGVTAPNISNVAQTPTIPTSSQSVEVVADVTDADGTVQSVTLYWATGTSGGTFSPLSMTLGSGSQYSGTIPAQANGTYVRWYIQAVDNDGSETFYPSTNPNTFTRLYKVIDGNPTIYDVQYTPYSSGSSWLQDQTVTVEGVVTAAINNTGAGDLGQVYIQQEGQATYAGIWLSDNVNIANLTSLDRGDKISVTGRVIESFGMTALTDITTAPTVLGTGTINPTVVVPDSFALYNPAAHEKYEGMLLRYEHPTAGQKLYVTQKNADSPNPWGEYRVGTTLTPPESGSRVIAGRPGSNCSYFVSFVNDSLFEPDMNVRPYIVNAGHTMESMTGILFYSFSNMKLLPRNNNDIVGYSGLVTANFDTDLDTACAEVNQDITFTNLSSVIADDLSWDFGDGSTGTAEEEIHAYATAGIYTVSLTATNTYDNESGLTTLDLAITEDGDCALGVEDRKAAITASAVVYPNPSSDELHVVTDFPAGTVYEIHILDIQGRPLVRRVTVLQNEQFNMSYLEAGTYFVEVKTTDGEVKAVQKFVKQ